MMEHEEGDIVDVNFGNLFSTPIGIHDKDLTTSCVL